MRVLCIGDVVGRCGCEFLRKKIKILRDLEKLDLIIANGENSAEGNGITVFSAEYLFQSGVDVITLGNHTFLRREIKEYMASKENIVRPMNYPFGTPGNGFCKIDIKGLKVGIVSMLGTLYMESQDSPFLTADKAIDEMQDCVIKIIDFHAEATAEKRAFGYYVDGRVSAVFGTHTHVQTSDNLILPNGTGYITDVGMTGVIDSILGVRKEISIERFVKKLPVKLQNASGASRLEGVIFDIDETYGKTVRTKRIRVFSNYGLN